MTERPVSPHLHDWLDETIGQSPDLVEGARQVMSGVEETPQAGRWLPFLLFHRKARTSTPTASDTTEYHSSPIPATNGHTPTVSGRTQSMLSPAKAITVGALVFALGGVMLVAQPFQQQGSVPGAEVEAGVAENTPFTMRFYWTDEVLQSGEETTERGVNKTIGDCWAMGIIAPSDARIDGDVTYCGGEHVYGEDRDADPNVWTATYRIVNDEGAWQGSTTGITWEDPSSGERMDETGAIILAGEGAYDGLYAAIAGPWSDVHGIIFEGAPPVGPILPSAE